MYDEDYYYDEYDDNYDDDLEVLAVLDDMDKHDREHSRSNSKGCLTTIVCFVISTTIIGMAIVGLFN